MGGKALEHPCGTLIFDPERDGGGAQRESRFTEKPVYGGGSGGYGDPKRDASEDAGRGAERESRFTDKSYGGGNAGSGGGFGGYGGAWEEGVRRVLKCGKEELRVAVSEAAIAHARQSQKPKS